MFKWIWAILDKILAVGGAFLFMQLPLFMQQYLQHLAGRIAELQLQVNSIQNAASMTGKTLEQFIQKFVLSEDVDFAHQGVLMHSMFTRWHQLSDAYFELAHCSLWKKSFLFFIHLDREVAKSTFEQYTMGLPLNLEGGLYALFGIVVGYLVFSCMRRSANSLGSFLRTHFTQRKVIR